MVMKTEDYRITEVNKCKESLMVPECDALVFCRVHVTVMLLVMNGGH